MALTWRRRWGNTQEHLARTRAAEEEEGAGSQEERLPSALTPPDDAGPISPAYGNVNGWTDTPTIGGKHHASLIADNGAATPKEKKRGTRSFMKAMFDKL